MEHNILLSIMLGILCSFLFIHSYAQESTSDTPEGYWKVVDNITGQPKSIIKIWQTRHHELKGKVIKVFTQEAGSQRCTACQGKLYNQPLLGLTILSGLQLTYPHQWGQGKLLNPENGKIYSCTLRTTDHGNKLTVRNYMGLPYFGRAEIWERVDLLS
ncbi:MAG: hypothetical protein K0S27_264 [Gammaproteobacteria bacterium]|jgi:uncharacterized protein (DUF2147 family)|nr:hypothetical protein [Gammaproteobacteria bacterium]